MTEFGYIVFGAGTAGCMLAAQLSEDPRTVLLLEAGCAGQTRAIDRAGRVAGAAGHRCGLGRCHHHPGRCRAGDLSRVRALGGSGAINAIAHVHGHPAIYDGWTAAGAAWLGHTELLPYFRLNEHTDSRDTG